MKQLFWDKGKTINSQNYFLKKKKIKKYTLSFYSISNI